MMLGKHESMLLKALRCGRETHVLAPPDGFAHARRPQRRQGAGVAQELYGLLSIWIAPSEEAVDDNDAFRVQSLHLAQ